MLRKHHKFRHGDKVKNSNVFLLLFDPPNNDRLKISIQFYSYNYISVTQLTIPATILTRELGEPVITS